MPSPMPRDSLGRIVYAGDSLTCGATVDCVLPSGGIGVAFPDGALSGFSPLLDSIDLASSPHRTNYERYFADLGTLSDVYDAYRSIDCHAEGWSCLECPFELVAGNCSRFSEWLCKEAVI